MVDIAQLIIINIDINILFGSSKIIVNGNPTKIVIRYTIIFNPNKLFIIFDNFK